MRETTKSREWLVIAADLGGTKLVTGLVSRDGTILDKHRQETVAAGGPQSVMNRLFRGIDTILETNRLLLSEILAVSIGFAGIIDMENGIVTGAPHLPEWEGIPLKQIIEKRYGVPAFILNDADAAALGEYRYGAGKGLKNIVMLTIGTGIGGGIIHEGKLFTGSSGSAAEMGHMIIRDDGPECSCGRRGCLESLISGTAIAAEAKKALEAGTKSAVLEMAGGRPEDVTSEKVFLAAREGDSLACRIINEAIRCLGVGVLNIVTIFNPEMVIIGGSMAQMGDTLLEPVRTMVKEKAFRIMVKDLEIVTANLGNDAGLVGAAAYAYDQE